MSMIVVPQGARNKRRPVFAILSFQLRSLVLLGCAPSIFTVFLMPEKDRNDLASLASFLNTELPNHTFLFGELRSSHVRGLGTHKYLPRHGIGFPWNPTILGSASKVVPNEIYFSLLLVLTRPQSNPETVLRRGVLLPLFRFTSCPSCHTQKHSNRNQNASFSQTSMARLH